MDRQAVLTKAIQRAMDNGYAVPEGQVITSVKDDWITYGSKHQKQYSEQVFTLIFNHDFAKALWGFSNDKCIYCHTGPSHYGYCPYSSIIAPPLWQYHLQQMVIADDPIEYLANTLTV